MLTHVGDLNHPRFHNKVGIAYGSKHHIARPPRRNIWPYTAKFSASPRYSIHYSGISRIVSLRVRRRVAGVLEKQGKQLGSLSPLRPFGASRRLSPPAGSALLGAPQLPSWRPRRCSRSLVPGGSRRVLGGRRRSGRHILQNPPVSISRYASPQPLYYIRSPSARKPPALFLRAALNSWHFVAAAASRPFEPLPSLAGCGTLLPQRIDWLGRARQPCPSRVGESHPRGAGRNARPNKGQAFRFGRGVSYEPHGSGKNVPEISGTLFADFLTAQLVLPLSPKTPATVLIWRYQGRYSAAAPVKMGTVGWVSRRSTILGRLLQVPTSEQLQPTKIPGTTKTQPLSVF